MKATTLIESFSARGFSVWADGDAILPKGHARTEAQDQRAIHCLNLVVTVFAYHSVVRFWDNLSL